MAKQKGAIKYVGTLGDIRHFKIKGLDGYYAGLVGGPTGEQIKTAPEFQRTRENMSEFGGCAKAGKAIRTALSPLLKHMADRRLTSRLTAIMKRINLEDGSEARGKRAVLISKVPHHLVGLDFNRSINFNSIFRTPVSISVEESRTSSTLAVPGFNPTNYLSNPNGATHFRMVHANAIISDFHFFEEDRSYGPIVPELNELVDIQYSDHLPVDQQTQDLALTSAFPDNITLTEDVSVLSCVGVEFYQKAGEQYYLLASGNCLKIHQVN